MDNDKFMPNKRDPLEERRESHNEIKLRLVSAKLEIAIDCLTYISDSWNQFDSRLDISSYVDRVLKEIDDVENDMEFMWIK